MERLDRTNDRHGGGIMTCIREGLAYSSSVISEDPECLITSIITGSATMKIVNFYVPLRQSLFQRPIGIDLEPFF